MKQRIAVISTKFAFNSQDVSYWLISFPPKGKGGTLQPKSSWSVFWKGKKGQLPFPGGTTKSDATWYLRLVPITTLQSITFLNRKRNWETPLGCQSPMTYYSFPQILFLPFQLWVQNVKSEFHPWLWFKTSNWGLTLSN